MVAYDGAMITRRALFDRILTIAGGGAAGLGLLTGVNCGPEVEIAQQTSSGSSGNGGAGSTSASTGAGGAGGSIFAGSSVASSASSSGGTIVVTVCIPPDPNGMCVDQATATGVIPSYLPCEQTLVAVVGGPSFDGMSCCYDVEVMEFPCYVGRTFFIDEGSIKADLRRGGTWTKGPVPDATGLNDATKRALAAAWGRDGLFEHASVASFARFTMQLLALGAPADLVRDAQAAALDEVKHAELSFTLASAYEGALVEPAGLPFPAPLAITPDLAAIVTESVMEGCIGETVATVQAIEALHRATDPAVREVLRQTAEDEARHAELAWRFLAWAVETGGERARAAAIRAFAGFHPPSPSAEDLEGVDLDHFARHGRQVAAEARAIAERTLREIVDPCFCALLARRGERARYEPSVNRNGITYSTSTNLP